MDITREEKSELKRKVRDAIGAGLTSGRMPEAPPMPPSRPEIDKAAEWAVGELARFLASKHWDNLQARERHEDDQRLIRTLYQQRADLRARIRDVESVAESMRERAANAAEESIDRIYDALSAVEAIRALPLFPDEPARTPLTADTDT